MRTNNWTEVFKYLRPGSLIYEKITSKSQNRNREPFDYKKMIISPVFYSVEGNQVKVVSAEWYQHSSYTNTPVWTYTLSYESGKWLIVENNLLSSRPGDFNFTSDPDRIEFTH